LDFAGGGHSPASAIVAFELGALPRSRPFAWSGRGRVDEAIRCRQLQPITIRRTSETDAFSASRMRTPRSLSGTLKSLHQAVSTSDVLVVARRHTRVGIRIRPMCFPSFTLLADGEADLNLQARGALLRPAGESKTGMSPRTPSFVSRACKR
jgi:hypothetical protein